jgi:hypothetical protein
MIAAKIMRSVIVALLLAPSLEAAAEVETAASIEQPAPSQMASDMKPDMVPPALMWPQMMPVARPMVYYWAPPPGMIWPVLPQYPAPMVMPPVVWVMVPIPSTSLTSAMVDYGPVADTPVMELSMIDAVPEQIMLEGAAATVDYGPLADTPVVGMPLPDSNTAQAMMEDAALAAALAQEGKVDAGPADVTSGVESATINGQSPAAGAVEPVAATVAVPVNVIPADYGPVTPTPVVDLLALESQGSKSPDSSRRPSRSTRKSGTPASPKPMAKATSEPAKRLCWTKGVVAPCR